MNFSGYFIEQQPLLGALTSILLFIGTYQLGNILFKIKLLNQIFINISDIDYLKSGIGIIFLILLLNPIILFFPYSKEVLIFVSYSLLILGVISIRKISNKVIIFKEFHKINLKNFFRENYLIPIFLIFLLLISLSPTTDADSLDYHLRVGKYLAKYGNFPENIFHFHERLSGPGEILIAIGLLGGASSFGSLIQSSGLLILFGIFKKIKKKHSQSNLYFLILLTTPIIFFFCTTSKPQLFFICTSLIVFAFIFFDKSQNDYNSNNIAKIIVSLSIISIATQVKFSFILGGFCLFVLLFFQSINNKLFKKFVFISLITFILIIFPQMLWKYLVFDFNFFQQVISPVPLNIPGMDFFYLYLTRVGTAKTFYSYLIPDNLLNFTNSLGLGIFFLILFKFEKNFKTKIIFCLLVFFISISVFFGQRTERFFYEPLIWLIFSSIYYGTRYEFKWLKYIFKTQVFLIILLSFYPLLKLSSGILSKDQRERVLKNNANGYELYKWANQELNEEDLVLTFHRSISFRFDKSLHFEFINFRGLKVDKKFYADKLIDKRPDYVLAYGKNYNENMPNTLVPEEIRNCVGKLVYFKENVGRHVGRNPFRLGSLYNGYIFKFKNDLLPNCIK